MLCISACSWLAGKRSLQFPNSRCRLRRCLYPLRAITLFSVCLERISTTAPPSLPPGFPGFPRYYAGLRLLPAPLQPFPFSELCRRLRLSPHADRSPGLSRLPFPTRHLRRHRQSDKQTPTVVRSVPDRLHRVGIGSSLWLYFFRCSLIWSSLSLWPISSEDAPLAASASRPHSGHLFRS
jgi:hypothetical protein